MFFKQITTAGLGCFSYAIGCPLAGTMAIIDPRRDIGIYLQTAEDNGMKITHIFETHVHADHISVANDLRTATGAEIYIHESAPINYPARRLVDGNEFKLGEVAFRVLHTPGHTPNSVSLLCFDQARSDEPEMILTGDLLFVGDIGRPDLPGEDILNEQVENLYNSLYELLDTLPDYLEVYPAHGQGSLCGKGMSDKPYSTLGYERLANSMLSFPNFDEFKHAILSNLPMRPQSFGMIIKANLDGLSSAKVKKLAGCSLSPIEAESYISSGAVALDLRDAKSFAKAHIPGSINVELSDSSTLNWVGVAVPPGALLLLILPDGRSFEEVETDLRRIGCDNIAGCMNGGMEAWIDSGFETRSLAYLSATELRERLADADPPVLIDVRSVEEFRNRSIRGSINITFDKITGGEGCPVDPDMDAVIICLSGFRSSIAASLLLAKGCKNVSVLTGGLNAW